MIIHSYEKDDRSANVCQQQGQWVVMLYQRTKTTEYLRTVQCANEASAEEEAERWVERIDDKEKP